MKQRILLGIEFNEDGLRIVEASIAGDAIASSRLVERSWPAPRAGEMPPADAIADFLATLVAEQEWSGREALLAWPRRFYVARGFKKTPSPSDEQAIAAKWLPSPLDHFYWSVRPSENGMVVGAFKNSMDAYRGMFEKAGLRVIGIAPKCEGYPWFLKNAGSDVSRRRYAVMDLSASAGEISVFDGDACVLSRMVPLSSRASAADALAEEMKASAIFVSGRYGDTPLGPVFVSGPVIPENLLVRLQKGNGTTMIVERKIEPMAALGLVHAAVKRVGFWFFSPVPLPNGALTFVRKRASTLAAAASVIFVILGMAAGGRGEKNRDAAGEMTRRLHRAGFEQKGVTVPTTASVDAAGFLAAVIQAVPDRCHLIDLSIDGRQKQITVHGRAKDYAVVSAYAHALLKDTRFKTLQNQKSNLTDVDGTSVVEFSMTIPL